MNNALIPLRNEEDNEDSEGLSAMNVYQTDDEHINTYGLMIGNSKGDDANQAHQ